MHEIVDFLLQTVGSWGYLGIFLLMFLESSFFPFPSEVVMIPAGYLAFKGEMNFFIAVFYGVLGSLAGALFNYYISLYLGRNMLLKYGKFVGLNEKKLDKFETFFNSHGEVATFTCRLIPGIRQYISLPAGLARMNIAKFSIYTTLGASIWVFILVGFGYFLGENQELVKEYLTYITIALIICMIIFLSYHFKLYKKIRYYRR